MTIKNVDYKICTFKSLLSWHFPRKKRLGTILLLTPKPNPLRNTKKHRAYTNFFENFARTFAFFPLTRVKNPTEIVQKNCSHELFYFGWRFWVDILGWNPVDFPLNSQSENN